ncbi:hypothetical protein [Paenibacillus xylanexedens]|uniref:hypothetical protein n=1 Tax=Paenibacillus xylanexedens TaxID=528191 RepID=UPI000F542749|nr:hypothetical protein [Paenibacillus xylanexedens]
MNFLNPSTLEGALAIGITAGLISSVIVAVFKSKAREKNGEVKSIIEQKGNGNMAIQNSKIGRDVHVREEQDNTKG